MGTPSQDYIHGIFMTVTEVNIGGEIAGNIYIKYNIPSTVQLTHIL